MDGWKEECKDAWKKCMKGGRMDAWWQDEWCGWRAGGTDGWVVGGRMGGRMNGWKDRWVDGRMDSGSLDGKKGRKDEWMEDRNGGWKEQKGEKDGWEE